MADNSNMERELFEAAQFRNLRQLRYLIEERRCNPNARTKTGKTLLHEACSYTSRSLAIAKYLVQEQHVAVNVVHQEFGGTPLHWACFSGDRKHTLRDMELVKLVAQSENGGADAVHIRDKRGMTPLHVACEIGFLGVIQYLIEERHADVNVKSKEVGSVLRHVLKGNYSCREKGDLVVYLMPLCRIDKAVFADVWRSCLWFPWQLGIRELFLQHFAEGKLRRSHQRDKFSFRSTPLQGLFYCPLPSERDFLEWISYFSAKQNKENRRNNIAAEFDDHGQLVLHVAIQASKVNSHVTPEILLRILRLEPRASIAKDPVTGFFPFEAVAATRRDVVLLGDLHRRPKMRFAFRGIPNQLNGPSSADSWDNNNVATSHSTEIRRIGPRTHLSCEHPDDCADSVSSSISGKEEEDYDDEPNDDDGSSIDSSYLDQYDEMSDCSSASSSSFTKSDEEDSFSSSSSEAGEDDSSLSSLDDGDESSISSFEEEYSPSLLLSDDSDFSREKFDTLRLNLVYQLFRWDPERLLSSRGLGSALSRRHRALSP